MNQKTKLRRMTPLLFALLLAGMIVLLNLNLRQLARVQIAPELTGSQDSVGSGEATDNRNAADVSATRWQAMARFYEEQGLLTRDPFDYEHASDHLAFRWQAMAEAYQRHGLLNYSSNPDDVMAFRWLAMARAYERAGMLNDQIDAGN